MNEPAKISSALPDRFDRLFAQLKSASNSLSRETDGSFRLTQAISLGNIETFLSDAIGDAELFPKDVISITGSLTLEELDWQPSGPGRSSSLQFAISWGAKKGFTLSDGVVLKIKRLAFSITPVKVMAYADAELDVFDFVAEVTAEFPSAIMTGSLHQTSGVDLTKHGLSMPAGSARTPASGGPHLDALNVYFALREKRLVLYVKASNLFHASPFALEAIEAQVTYAAGPTGGLDAALWTRMALELPSPHPKLEFDLSAAKTGKNWHFEASLVRDHKLQVGAIAEAIAGKMHRQHAHGSLNIPSIIANTDITGMRVSFDTGTGFEFYLGLEIEELDGLTCEVHLSVGDQGATARGIISVDAFVFEIDFSKGKGAQAEKIILATLAAKHKVGLLDLVSAIDPDAASIVPPVDIGIKSAAFGYVSGGATQRAPGSGTQKPKARKVASLDLEAALNLTAFPQLGGSKGKSGALGDILVCYAFDALTPEDVTELNTLLAGTKAAALPTPRTSASTGGSTGQGSADRGMAKGFSIRTDIDLGFGKLPLQAGNTAPASTQAGSGGGAVASVGEAPAAPVNSGNVQWFTIQKSLGPFYVDKVGFNYADKKIWFILNASLSLGPLSLGLLGAKVGSPISEFHPEFGLDGLTLEYKSGPVEIGGGFLEFEGQYHGQSYQGFAGTVIAKAEILSASAIGAYAQLPNDVTSLFLYAALNYPIGGPPFFFLTGLAGGMGYNRRVVVPKAEDVPRFPFVSAITGGPQQSPAASSPGGLQKIGDTLNAELSRLNTTLPIDPGEIFFALGVRFTTFEMLDSVVVLSIEFGNRFEVDVLGLTTLVVPTPPPGETADASTEPPILELQLATKASFAPEDGYLKVRSVLTPNSFLFSRQCRITGGLALYAWFEGSKEGAPGDVVITIGGYHSKFHAPDYYPRVPRLGFNWRINSEIGIKGDAYFALTPHAVMAGAHLQALWQSGPLKAWFVAGADFLLSWQPYAYDAEINVSIGADLTFNFFGTHHLTVEIGGDLHIWGPEFAGSVTIRYWVFSVTVHFGSGKTDVPPLTWEAFRHAFLAKNGGHSGILKMTPKAGLLATIEDQQKKPHWICNPSDLDLEIASKIPVTHPQGNEATGKDLDAVGIASMGITAAQFSNNMIVTVRDSRGRDITTTWFKCVPGTSHLPAAMWAPAADAGKAPSPDLNAAKRTIRATDRIHLRPHKIPADADPTKNINSDNLLNHTRLRNKALTKARAGPARKIKPVKPKEVAAFSVAHPANGNHLLKALGIG